MTDNDPRQFQQKIYRELDEKLRSTGWKSGASEAHGLLAGLACRGVTSSQVANRFYLFQVDEEEDLPALQGLFELVLADLESSEPTFNLLLDDGSSGLSERIDEVANWCAGFLQGFCSEGSAVLKDCSQDVQELIQDIMEISGMQADQPPANKVKDEEEEERALTEVEEYLRVGVQLIYDDLVGVSRSATHPAADEIH